MAKYTGIFRGKLKPDYTDEIFWNPAGSPMSARTEGKENLNLSFFVSDTTNYFLTRKDIGDALFDAIKAVVCLGGEWRPDNGQSDPEARDFVRFVISMRDLKTIERNVKKGAE